MKKFVVAALLVTVMSGSAFADRGYRAPAYNHYHHRGGYHSDWVGPLLFFGLTAAALAAATQQPPPEAAYVLPAPVEAAPQVAPQPAPVGVWYFCRSSGQYYPYVRSCPEAWEPVPSVPPQ
jgi:hypothetical protein